MPALPAPRPLVEHRPGVWLKESWLRFGGFTLQTRMTVIRLDDGLLVHSPSPAPLDDETRRELEALGAPRWLLAPNEVHNVGLETFQAAYPEAHTTGCVGHPRRVPKVRFDVLLDASSSAESVPWTQTGEIAMHVIGGNGLLHEVALLHRPTRTLVLTDAVEYIDPAAHLAEPLPSRIVLGTMERFGFRLGGPCMSPEHHLVCRDPAALRASFETIDGWPFDAMIIAHGRLLEGAAARDALRDAFTATIDAATKRSKPARALFDLLARL